MSVQWFTFAKKEEEVEMKFVLSKVMRLCGYRSPRGYREAYYDAVRGNHVFYPIGIHLIVRMGYTLWRGSICKTKEEVMKAVEEWWLA
jgi:hypothetical protein